MHYFVYKNSPRGVKLYEQNIKRHGFSSKSYLFVTLNLSTPSNFPQDNHGFKATFSSNTLF